MMTGRQQAVSQVGDSHKHLLPEDRSGEWRTNFDVYTLYCFTESMSHRGTVGTQVTPRALLYGRLGCLWDCKWINPLVSSWLKGFMGSRADWMSGSLGQAFKGPFAPGSSSLGLSPSLSFLATQS